ncbi:cation transporter [Pseudomonadota bacterium]
MSGCDCELEVTDKAQARTLVILLAINLVMFVAEVFAGVIGQSTALIADSLDMLADAFVYAVALYAVGKSLYIKANIARATGIFQLALGVGVLFDIARRLLIGSEPESLFMMIVGLAALIANTVCLILIYKHRNGEVHMRASWIYSKNDIIANIGVILGGALVAWQGAAWPDLVIGLVIACLVIRGGVHIMRDAAEELKRTV